MHVHMHTEIQSDERGNEKRTVWFLRNCVLTNPITLMLGGLKYLSGLPPSGYPATEQAAEPGVTHLDYLFGTLFAFTLHPAEWLRGFFVDFYLFSVAVRKSKYQTTSVPVSPQN